MANVVKAEPVIPDWINQYRIIPSKYPPISLFEDCADPDLLEELYAVESLTNDRLLEEVGALSLVRPEDRMSGTGSSPVMAAFTHASKGRFTDGTFGAYYAADSMETAFAETIYSRTKFMRYTNEEPGEIDMRAYVGEVLKPLLDVRGIEFDELHDPDNWAAGQQFAKNAVIKSDWGILYRSVRKADGECLAALRPPAVSIPRQGPHFGYVWNGKEITNIVHKRIVT
jgi:hypothetical protein